MKCVVIDDEPLAIEIIETYLGQVKGIERVYTFTDAVEGFTFLQQEKVDLLFLDLNMPLLTGMDLLKSLMHRPTIIITTAYRDFAVESFELDVMDYLVKPIAFPRFLKAVNKAMLASAVAVPEVKSEGADHTIWLKVDKKLIPIQSQDILYIQSLKDYVRVVTNTQKVVVYHTLQAILEKLPANAFLRIHKSYIIQVSKVESIQGARVNVAAVSLPIGRNFRKDLLQRVS